MLEPSSSPSANAYWQKAAYAIQLPFSACFRRMPVADPRIKSGVQA
jgi:hypothetical protein